MPVSCSVCRTGSPLCFRILRERSLSAFSYGSYEDASIAFSKADNYKDASDRILEPFYVYAEVLLANGQYSEASEAFVKAGTYRDAADRVQEPYYIEGKNLIEAGSYREAVDVLLLCAEYSDASELIKQAYYYIGLADFAALEYDTAIVNFENAGSYADAVDKIAEIKYAKVSALGEEKKYEEALKILSEIQDKPDAVAKAAEYNYYAGVLALDTRQYDKAISFLTKAGNYEGAQDRLTEAYSAKMQGYLSKQKFDKAYEVYTAAQTAGIALEDVVVVSPGDDGELALSIVMLGKDLGCVYKSTWNETGYSETHVDEIMKMENAFGLEADGVITLSEIVTLRSIMYPGYTSSAVSPILERLRDLGFIQMSLADDHSTYLPAYSYSVKMAEQSLGLTVDGFLTAEEQNIILKQKATAPKMVEKINAQSYNGVVSLSWTASEGALWYEIYRGTEKIATVNSTYYRDDKAQMGELYVYSVKACKYSTSSDKQFTFIEVDIVYTYTTASSLVQNYLQYYNTYVRLGGLSKGSAKWDGKDLYIMANNGKDTIYLLFQDYNSWSGSVSIYKARNVYNISVDGKVTGKKNWYPVVTVNSATFNYS